MRNEWSSQVARAVRVLVRTFEHQVSSASQALDTALSTWLWVLGGEQEGGGRVERHRAVRYADGSRGGSVSTNPTCDTGVHEATLAKISTQEHRAYSCCHVRGAQCFGLLEYVTK